MSVQKSPRTREQDEAAEWLARLGNHSISTETVRAFRAWRDNPANDAAYQEAEAVWEASGRHAADPEIMRMTEAALARGRSRRWPGLIRGRPLAWVFALAALLLLGVPLYAATQLWFPVYRTGPGEQRVVRLEDGTRLHLNVDSRARVRFGNGERRVVLQRGEAFFDVAHDAAKPFIVEADGTDVRALGTKFDVHRSAGGVQVRLVEGLVRVNTAGRSEAWTLKPNQALVVTGSGKVQTRTTDTRQATSWTTGRLSFRETPLAEAVAEVNRYGTRKILLEGRELAGLRVSGYFDVGDTDAFVRGVAALFDLHTATGADGAVVLSQPPGAGA